MNREPETPDTSALLHRLFSENRIRARQGSWLHVVLDDRPRSWDRVEGMLLGLAIGDALGNRSEGINPEDRLRRHGEIRDYLPNPHAGGARVGTPSDDSQMAFWTAEELVATGRLDPDRLARRFAHADIFGIGRTVQQFRIHYGFNELPWWEAGPESAGNGALMRIAPIVLPHLREPSPALWHDTALATMITHNDSAALASSVAFIALLWDLLCAESAPPGEWYAQRFVAICAEVETGKHYRPRHDGAPDWSGPLSAWVRQQLAAARAECLSVRDAQRRWYSGAYLLETVPTVLYILERHAHDPEEAIVRAVNDSRDNDTVAAVVGAAVGALHGASALPRRWRDGLTGRTGTDDDGAMFRILEAARARFWEGYGPEPEAGR